MKALFRSFLGLLLFSFACWAEEPKADPLAAIGAKLQDKSKPFTMIVKISIKQEKIELFKSAAQTAVEATRLEKGNLAYEVHQFADDPTQFVFFEKWENFEALKSHFAEEHTKGILATLGEVGAAEPKIEVYTPFVTAKKKKTN